MTTGPRPRGRPREAERAARRDALLDTALPLFLAQGYAGTSIQQVALAAGVAKRTIYATVGDKADLFIAVVRRLGDRVIGQVERAPDDLRGFCLGLVDLMLSDQPIGLHRLVTAEATTFPDLAARLYATGPRRYIGALRDLLSRTNPDRLRVDPAHLDVAAEQLFTALLGEPHRRRLFAMSPAPTGTDIERHVDAVLALFVAPAGPG